MKKRWRKLYSMDTTFTCPYCLRQVPFEETNIDHIVPRSRGGQTTPENIIRTCKSCNATKGALTLEEFVEWKRLEFIRNGGLSQGKKR